jgi:peptide/nickel transport system permease protein
MFNVIVRRLMFSVPLLISVSLVSFGILKSAPGDPVAMYLSQPFERAPQEVIDAMRARLGLDRPLHVQYLTWLKETVRGNLGTSMRNFEPVHEIIARTLPQTILLMGLSFVIGLAAGILLGIYSALRPYGIGDQFLGFIASLGYAVPNFWLGLMLIYLFSMKLGWLPSGGMMSMRDMGDPLLDRLRHLILPITTIVFRDIVVWMRYQRDSLLTVLGEDYIRTARAKGLVVWVVVAKHALRNSLIPVISLIGMSMPRLLTGSYVIENVFSWPGMGRVGLDAINNRDYPLILGILLLSSVLVVMGNLLADISYALIDPRIKYS